MKKSLAVLGLAVLLSLSASAYAMPMQNLGNLAIGFVKVGSAEVGNLAWHPDFKLGAWGVGLDVNYPLGQNKPFGYENVVPRYVDYNDGQKGLRYGVLDNVTWGHGLIMKGFSTRIAGPVILNDSQLALKGFVNLNQGGGEVMWTKTGISALRLTENINSSLTLGQSYVTDVVGVTPAGTSIVQKVTEVGIDVSIPLPMNFEGYAEYAQMVDHGKGISAGVSWAYDMMVARSSFLAEYRLIDKNFVPNYFGPEYLTDPVNLASAEATGNAKNGYLVQFDLDALGLAKLGIIYESYNESNASLNANLWGRLSEMVTVAGYYKQPDFVDFRSLSLQQGAVMGADVTFKTSAFTSIIAHYKQVYNPATAQVEESQYYEMQFNF